MFHWGFVKKKHWSNKVLPLYNDLLYSIDLFSRSFEIDDALKLMDDGSLFKTFLHFFYANVYVTMLKVIVLFVHM